MVVFGWQGMTSYYCLTVTLGLGGTTVELQVIKGSGTIIPSHQEQ